MPDEIKIARTTEPDPAALATAAEPGLGELFRQLSEDSATLVRQELALAKAEMRENVKSAARSAGMIAVGGFVAVIGILVLIAFLVMIVGELLGPAWAGALVVGLLFLIVGGLLAKRAMTRLKEEPLAPEETIRTLKEDKQWLQSEIQQAKRELA